MSGWDEEEDWDAPTSSTSSQRTQSNNANHVLKDFAGSGSFRSTNDYQRNSFANTDRGTGRGFLSSNRGSEHSNWRLPVLEDDRSDTLTIYVANSEAGRIIGRGGSRIRDLQDQSGARIQIRRADRNASDTPVDLSGRSDAVVRAKELIAGIVNIRTSLDVCDSFSSLMVSDDRPYSSNTEDSEDLTILMVPNQAIGRIIGSRGSKIRELQLESGARISVRKGDSGPFETPVDMTGTIEARDKAKRLIEDILSSTSGQPRASGGSSDRSSDDPVTTIHVGNRDLGKIIGRGGGQIREIQDESGCSINIRSDDQDNYETPIDLKGSQEVRDKAQELIEKLVIVREAKFTVKGLSLNSNEPAASNGSSNSDFPSIPFIDWDRINAEKDVMFELKWKDHPSIIKNFYIEDLDVANMHPSDVAMFRKENNNIIVQDLSESGEQIIPNPVQTFHQAFQHYPDILDQLYKQGFHTPSPIQCQAWPVVLQGMDLIGIAQTGTGKTLAFLLPGLIHIQNQPIDRSERGGPTMLVLSPTRELAQQIEEETKKINYRGIRCVCIYGGGDRRAQIALVKQGAEIVVATPGRLNDLVMNEIIDVKTVTFLVLDEADRMLDMGFEPQIRKILIDIRPDRQTVMTSATWPAEVRRLGEQYMKNPIQVFINTLDLAACHAVTQLIEMVDESEKKERVIEFIENMAPDDKLLIFVGKKIIADDVSSDFSLRGIVCQCIHGDREQSDRETALREFKNGEVRILIATDVASRGLDVPDITHVLNYDFPRHIEEYVHRVGRTGRAGRTGIALSFVTREDWRKAPELIDIMAEAQQEIPDELLAMAERYLAWKERKDLEKAELGARRGGGSGGGFRRGGRRDNDMKWGRCF